MTARRIAVVTTSRAGYGCLRHLLRAVEEDPSLVLQLVATGMHLAREHGHTVDEIEADGFAIARRVPMLLADDDEASIAKSVGIGLLAFADAWRELAPDVVVCLGDRFELFAPVIAAFLQRIPIAHIHGGETSEGALDEGVRHSVTKMAAIHFPATQSYARRIAQMGELPERIFACGAPALDALHAEPLLERDALAERVGLPLTRPTALVTYHPVTLELEQTDDQVAALLSALERSGLDAVITRANADAGGGRVNAALEAFCERNPKRFRLHAHLGQQAYFSCLRHLDVMIGNSSSGLVEAPSFALPVVNIGNRQRGRVRAHNVIDVACDPAAILAAIERAQSTAFRTSLRDLRNPYDLHGDGRTSHRIKEHLRSIALGGDLLIKPFHDLPGTDLQ